MLNGTKRSCAPGAIAIVAIGLAALLGGRAEATTVFGCTPSKVKVISQTPLTNRSTTSSTFVDVPLTTTHIVRGGTASSCVIVDFSAMVSTDPGTALNLRALLDGGPGLPASSQVIYNNTVFEARSVRFVFNGVAPGMHTVKLQFNSSQSGKIVYINSSNITIQYAP